MVEEITDERPPLAVDDYPWSAECLHTPNWTIILDQDSDSENVAIEVEGNLDILPVQVRPSRVVKTGCLATAQNKSTNRLGIARPAFQPITEVDRADLLQLPRTPPWMTVR